MPDQARPFLRVSLSRIKTAFRYDLEPMSCSDRSSYMEHDQKVWATATLLLERYGQNAPEVAGGWSRDLTERKEPDAAARCLKIVDAARKLLTANAAREPKLVDLLSGAVTGQMMRADRVEQRDVETLMKNAKSRRRAKHRRRPDHAA
jgi:hypothetical protein